MMKTDTGARVTVLTEGYIEADRARSVTSEVAAKLYSVANIQW